MAGTESHEEHERKKYFAHILEEKLLLIILAPLLAILITAFVFHFYRVDGSSMEMTFKDQDVLLVEKLGKTSSTILRKNYTPNRYDVIVFKQPNYDPDRELIKRVIGLPGDRVVIKNEQVVVYNEQNPKGININENLPPEAEAIGSADKFDKKDLKIKEEEVFVMGDNRLESDDSRYFGPVQTENIIGKVVIRIFPFNNLLIL